MVYKLNVDLRSSERFIVRRSRNSVNPWDFCDLSGSGGLVFNHKLLKLLLSFTDHQVPGFNFWQTKSVTMVINHVFMICSVQVSLYLAMVSPSKPSGAKCLQIWLNSLSLLRQAFLICSIMVTNLRSGICNRMGDGWVGR